jgi:hypothetical protein
MPCGPDNAIGAVPPTACTKLPPLSYSLTTLPVVEETHTLPEPSTTALCAPADAHDAPGVPLVSYCRTFDPSAVVAVPPLTVTPVTFASFHDVAVPGRPRRTTRPLPVSATYNLFARTATPCGPLSTAAPFVDNSVPDGLYSRTTLPVDETQTLPPATVMPVAPDVENEPCNTPAPLYSRIVLASATHT